MARPDADFAETRALRITTPIEDSRGEIEKTEESKAMLPRVEAMGHRLQALSLDLQSVSQMPNTFLTALSHLERLELRNCRIHNPEQLALLGAMGPRVRSLELIATPVEIPLPHTFLPLLTGLKSLQLRLFGLSNASVAQLISLINNGVCSVTLVPSNPKCPHHKQVFEYITRRGSTCDRDSIAAAHYNLGNAMTRSLTTNPHALAILDLGLPEDNKYVLWAMREIRHNPPPPSSEDDGLI
jgi:hypothetical protein